ncbi:MAG: hypothetical protein ACKVS6_03745 [Planctomycetota bacterium]
MTTKRIALVITLLLLLAAGAAAATYYFVKYTREKDESNIELEEAKRLLEDARSMGDWSRARNILATVQTHASKAAATWEGNAIDAWIVEGEALLRMTKFREAGVMLEKALTRRPDDAHIIGLAAEASFHLYMISRRAADFDAAFSLMERAVGSNPARDLLLKAAILCNTRGQFERADQYISQLESSAPDSVEAAEARGLKAARAAEESK